MVSDFIYMYKYIYTLQFIMYSSIYLENHVLKIYKVCQG